MGIIESSSMTSKLKTEMISTGRTACLAYSYPTPIIPLQAQVKIPDFFQVQNISHRESDHPEDAFVD